MPLRLITCLLLFIYLNSFSGDNLVINSSLDDYVKTGQFYNGFEVIKPNQWEYTNQKDVYPVYVRKVKFETELSETPQRKVTSLVIINQLPHSNAIYTKLKRKLKIGTKYYFNIDVQQHPRSNCFSDFIIGFSHSQPQTCKIQTKYRLKCEEFNPLIDNGFIKYRIKTSFTALDDYSFFTIGTTNSNLFSSVLESNKSWYMSDPSIKHIDSRFFIDNIELIEEPDYAKKLRTKGTANLNNLNFETNSYEIQNEESLQELLFHLKNSDNYKLTIIGHTDDVGKNFPNQILSHNRASEVKNYFVNNGIDSNFIFCYGMAYKQPLIDSTSEEARALNRRVEFKLEVFDTIKPIVGIDSILELESKLFKMNSNFDYIRFSNKNCLLHMFDGKIIDNPSSISKVSLICNPINCIWHKVNEKIFKKYHIEDRCHVRLYFSIEFTYKFIDKLLSNLSNPNKDGNFYFEKYLYSINGETPDHLYRVMLELDSKKEFKSKILTPEQAYTKYNTSGELGIVEINQ
jgi:outer membrane protein OmpA-like peptidoglycan-associated protein